jgi:asparagine synthase (glutamine-hydrolysing)
MCGFAGIVAWEKQYRIDPFSLQRMSNRLAHRGPDGEGLWLNHEHTPDRKRPQCGMAFRRLAILDPKERSNQPFISSDGRFTIVFNGEIYNFHEVQDEINRLNPDYQWRTTGDAEVLLMAFHEWRHKCVGKLNGMFAFAVWDKEENSLTLVRDRMGQKPLFYCARNGVLAFASELSALRTLEWFDSTIDKTAFSDYLRWGVIAAPATIYARAKKLPPASWLRCASGGVSAPQMYFDPNDVPPARDDIDFVGETRRLMIQSVRRQLISDVPLGCFLSGGIDSSVIAAAMRIAVTASQPVHTFSIGFEESAYDETDHARRVANHLKTTHHEFKVKPDVAEDLPKLASVYGEPFGDSSALPTHYLSRETRKHVKVALSGDGGDEMFGGYDRYRAMLVGQKVQNLPGPLRSLVTAKMWQHLPGSHPKGFASRFKRMNRSIDEPPDQRYASYLRMFDEIELANLLIEPPAVSGADVAKKYAEFQKSRDVVQAALATDRVMYLPDDLLTKLDRASMLNGLEVRSPFMDHDVVRFAASLPTEKLLKDEPKQLLRDAFKGDLPDEVFDRPKMGFAVPIGDWFRASLRPMLTETLTARTSFASKHFRRESITRLLAEHHERSADHSQRLYSLLMLELWWGQQAGGSSG